ncbi:hypothetical protein CC77DRAFT_291031 [Alternaria alternata]|uniref:Uncharacterized protein n=1 Tax=Alternaria alternata TaxID=5599 RepID=A0A177DZ07_ALTAL|nr:hypothetical protein CC77DRAFT_291031 [Alternaria alternata]OAG24954.1 hypothetical protein CC77DRAFT_291031 [Alternaria alternata]
MSACPSRGGLYACITCPIRASPSARLLIDITCSPAGQISFQPVSSHPDSWVTRDHTLIHMCLLVATATCFFVRLVNSSPIPPIREGVLQSSQSPTASDKTQTVWSRQDIFALASICVAIAGIFIGLLIASPKLRYRLRESLHCKGNPCSLRNCTKMTLYVKTVYLRCVESTHEIRTAPDDRCKRDTTSTSNLLSF